MSEPTTRYWIQDISPDGSYHDSHGLGEANTMETATLQLIEWRQSYPERKSRLILKISVVVMSNGQISSIQDVPRLNKEILKLGTDSMMISS